MRCFILLTMLLTLAFPATAKPVVLSAIAECPPLAKTYRPVESGYEKGLIFKVEGCNGAAPSYILGTMHHDDPAFLPIVDDAKKLIGSADAAGFEFVEDSRAQQVALQYMLSLPTDPNGLDTLLTTDEFRRLADVIGERAKIPPMVLKRLRPWAAALLLQYPKPKADGMALDSRLQAFARSLDKTVFGLETPEEQYEVFSSIPRENQLRMLKDAIAELENIDESNETLAKAYVNRDLKEIQRQADQSFQDMKDTALRDHLKQRLVSDRNKVMAERSLRYFDRGNQFVAFGALHLFGADGVLTLLEKEGYRITVVK